MPTARSGGGAATINNKIYVAGGRPPRGHDFAMYDPATDQWTPLPDLPTARNHLVVVAINDKVYVVGGRFEAGAASPMTDVVEVFDPFTKKWSTAKPMPMERGGINGVVANGCIHVFGGEGNRAAKDGMFPYHDVFNPQTGTWSAMPDMPIPVHGVVGAAFLNGLIYLPGGAKGQGGTGRSDLLQTYLPAVSCARVRLIG
jgi:N-acetylneuraminic acid mutarotase